MTKTTPRPKTHRTSDRAVTKALAAYLAALERDQTPADSFRHAFYLGAASNADLAAELASQCSSLAETRVVLNSAVRVARALAREIT